MADSAAAQRGALVHPGARGRPDRPVLRQPIGARERVPGGDGAGRDRPLNAAVAARQYTGVQDYDDWRGEPADRYDDYWDPDEAPPRLRARSPRGRAMRGCSIARSSRSRQRASTCRGTRRAATTTRSGRARSLPRRRCAIVTACFKVFPNDKFDPDALRAIPGRSSTTSATRTSSTRSSPRRLVPPDPNRRFLHPGEYKALHEGADNGHGFGFVVGRREPEVEGRRRVLRVHAQRHPLHRDRHERRGRRPDGNVDDPQYQWIESELRTAKRRGQLAIGYAHHPLSTDGHGTDEDAPRVRQRDGPRSATRPAQEHADPPRAHGAEVDEEAVPEVPELHLLRGRATSTRTRIGRTSARAARVLGDRDSRRDRLAAAGPRLIEVMNNRDGTLSIFGTMVDTAAPVAEPAPGAAVTFTT